MPIVDEKAPSEVSFDSMVNELKDITPDTACVFNCQVDEHRNDRRVVEFYHCCFICVELYHCCFRFVELHHCCFIFVELHHCCFRFVELIIVASDGQGQNHNRNDCRHPDG